MADFRFVGEDGYPARLFNGVILSFAKDLARTGYGPLAATVAIRARLLQD